MQLKPPADATDFQGKEYLSELDKIWAQIRQGEFDLTFTIDSKALYIADIKGGKINENHCY